MSKRKYLIEYILGVRYKVYPLERPNDYMQENGLGGYCDFKTKEIFYNKNSWEKERVLLHELNHAFLFESGINLGTLFHTEEAINWFSKNEKNIVEKANRLLKSLR